MYAVSATEDYGAFPRTMLQQVILTQPALTRQFPSLESCSPVYIPPTVYGGNRWVEIQNGHIAEIGALAPTDELATTGFLPPITSDSTTSTTITVTPRASSSSVPPASSSSNEPPIAPFATTTNAAPSLVSDPSSTEMGSVQEAEHAILSKIIEELYIGSSQMVSGIPVFTVAASQTIPGVLSLPELRPLSAAPQTLSWQARG